VLPLQDSISSLTKFVRRWHWFFAGALLALMFGLSLGAMSGDSAIVDEVAHIPAAYSYLHYGDYRLNPEHPPLMKDLASVPLQFMNLMFPDYLPAWTTDVNGQWELGWNFLYHIGNDAAAILFWSRLPILLVAVAFGLWLYWYARRRWGTGVGLMTLAFYALSPNILGHDHFVTTDLGATVFTLAALLGFAWFMEKPSWRRVLALSGVLALAQLAKFNGVLLYPFLGLVALVVAAWRPEPKRLAQRVWLYLGRFVSASALSLLWIWIYYVPQTINMPAEVQDKLIQGSLVDQRFQWVVHALSSMNDISIFKPLAQYLLGVAMVFGRVSGGNVAYLNGTAKNGSFLAYFPELFMVKTQVALLILMAVVAGAVAVLAWRKRHSAPLLERLSASVQAHLAEWTMGGYALFYFLLAVVGNLDLGIRHVLPVYGPVFLLTAIGTVHLAGRIRHVKWQARFKLGVIVLMVWYGLSTLIAYPSYTAYFNELIGGPDNAGKYFSDSNVDWGQDLIRLKEYVDENPQIQHIAVDYFGGGVPAYYFCERAKDSAGNPIYTAAGYDCTHSKFEEWHSQYGRYTGEYIAVSETFLENDRYYAALNGTEGYAYLRAMEPIAEIGHSIYVYRLH